MSEQAKRWIEEIAPFAVRSSVKFGMPASLSIAQAALETGWGKHAPSFNYFGIKGRGPAGSISLQTKEVVGGDSILVRDTFRAYNNPEESFDDHNRMLAESGFYEETRKALPDSVAMAHTLTGVYATDPEYGKKLEQIITKYRLKRFDQTKPPVIQGKSIWRLIFELVWDRIRRRDGLSQSVTRSGPDRSPSRDSGRGSRNR